MGVACGRESCRGLLGQVGVVDGAVLEFGVAARPAVLWIQTGDLADAAGDACGLCAAVDNHANGCLRDMEIPRNLCRAGASQAN